MSDASLASESVSQPLVAEQRAACVFAPRESAATWARASPLAGKPSKSLLARLSDWFNPILVKETRQALRSWQFALTFILLLVACWVVTFGGIAVIGPSIYYAAGGGELLRAYFLILSLPLLVVVPFAAFRSLAAEREDNTYDLVSITTLRPRQIISGKLASSVVQMIMFFSAITPCLAFTYLLRGVDTPTIALLLGVHVPRFVRAVDARLAAGDALAAALRTDLMLSVGFVALLLYVCYVAQTLLPTSGAAGLRTVQRAQLLDRQPVRRCALRRPRWCSPTWPPRR